MGACSYEKTATDFRIFFEYMGLGSFWDVLYRRKVALKYAPRHMQHRTHTADGGCLACRCQAV